MEMSREPQGDFAGDVRAGLSQGSWIKEAAPQPLETSSSLFLGLLGLGEGIPMNMFVLFVLIGCCVMQREVTTLGTPAENRDFNPAAQRKLGKNTYICCVALGSWLRG